MAKRESGVTVPCVPGFKTAKLCHATLLHAVIHFAENCRFCGESVCDVCFEYRGPKNIILRFSKNAEARGANVRHIVELVARCKLKGGKKILRKAEQQ